MRLYKDEMVLQSGEVQLKETVENRGKRVRSPGLTPPRRTGRQRIEPGEFGDRLGNQES